MGLARTFSRLIGAALILTACDRADAAQLEAVRAELEAARADQQRAEERLALADEELLASHREIKAIDAVMARRMRRGVPADNTSIEELQEQATSAITCTAEGQCTVDRGFLDQALADPAALASQARIVPSVNDGVRDGFKLYRIRRGSVAKLLGLENGDRITAINDLPLTTADEALSAYTTLRTSTTLVLRFDRGGQPMSRTIEIVVAAPE